LWQPRKKGNKKCVQKKVRLRKKVHQHTVGEKKTEKKKWLRGRGEQKEVKNRFKPRAVKGGRNEANGFEKLPGSSSVRMGQLLGAV